MNDSWDEIMGNLTFVSHCLFTIFSVGEVLRLPRMETLFSS